MVCFNSPAPVMVDWESKAWTTGHLSLEGQSILFMHEVFVPHGRQRQLSPVGLNCQVDANTNQSDLPSASPSLQLRLDLKLYICVAFGKMRMHDFYTGMPII